MAGSPGPGPPLSAVTVPDDSRGLGVSPSFAPPPLPPYLSHHHHQGMSDGIMPVMGPYGMYFQVSG